MQRVLGQNGISIWSNANGTKAVKISNPLAFCRKEKHFSDDIFP
ncbi:hypothetical protein [Arachidicoccus ginsenosidimutans]|nr:hypothetical protein [Arachidicoccus sp. BS20]